MLGVRKLQWWSYKTETYDDIFRHFDIEKEYNRKTDKMAIEYTTLA